jgi:hypothetical protein
MMALAVIMISAAAAASFLTFAHRPSDVIAAILLVGTLSSLVLPLTGLAPRPSVRGPALALLLSVSAAAIMLWAVQLLPVHDAGEPSLPLAPLSGTIAVTLWVTLVLIGEPSGQIGTVSAVHDPRHS